MIIAELWDDDDGGVFLKLFEDSDEENSPFAYLGFRTVNIIPKEKKVILDCSNSKGVYSWIYVSKVRDCRGRSGPKKSANAPQIFPLEED